MAWPCLVFGDQLNLAAAAILLMAGADGFETDFGNLAPAARTVAAGGVSFEPVSAAAVLQLARAADDPRLYPLSAVARSCAQGIRWMDAAQGADPEGMRHQLELLRTLL